METSLREAIEVKRASYDDKIILRHLLELYCYDFSEFDGADVDEHGLFNYKYLDQYWTDINRHPFLIRVAGKIAGFALIHEAERQGYDPSFFMAEFFIVKKYRRKGIGGIVAYHFFDLYRGEWYVSQILANRPAQLFWHKVIDHYTEGKFEEIRAEDWEGIIQNFNTRQRNPADGDASLDSRR
jgi:predicted acetyltransferase